MKRLLGVYAAFSGVYSVGVMIRDPDRKYATWRKKAQLIYAVFLAPLVFVLMVVEALAPRGFRRGFAGKMIELLDDFFLSIGHDVHDISRL